MHITVGGGTVRNITMIGGVVYVEDPPGHWRPETDEEPRGFCLFEKMACYFCFVFFITLSRPNSSLSFSSKASDIYFIVFSNLGMLTFFRAFARR